MLYRYSLQCFWFPFGKPVMVIVVEGGGYMQKKNNLAPMHEVHFPSKHPDSPDYPQPG